jgi:Lrp/AsnC family leucine-responsive transcriptional regulator
MDALDEKIITHLAEDARMPLAQIAKRLGMATATVHQRVKRLRDQGVLLGTRAILDWDQVGLPIVAMISLQVGAGRSLSAAADELTALPYLQGCFAVTGEFDLMAIVRARSSEHLGSVIEEMRTITRGSTRTTVVLNTFFEGRVPPLGPEPAT